MTEKMVLLFSWEGGSQYSVKCQTKWNWRGFAGGDQILMIWKDEGPWTAPSSSFKSVQIGFPGVQMSRAVACPTQPDGVSK